MSSNLQFVDTLPDGLAPPPRFDAAAYPRTYRPSLFMRLGVAASSLIFAAGTGWLIGRATDWRPSGVHLAIVVSIFAFMLLGVVDHVRGRLVLHADRLVRVSAFGTRELRLADIASWRILESQYVKFIVLQPREGLGRAIKIPLRFRRDAAWTAWFGRIRSPDDEGRKASLARVLGDEELGMRPDDRVHALLRVRLFARVAMFGIYAVGIWAIYAWRYVEPVVAFCLALPVVAFVLAGARPMLLTLQEPRRSDVRASLWLALLVAALVPLAALARLLDFASVVPLIAPAVVLGALASACALAADPTVRERKAAVVAIVIPMMLYGAGLAAWLNHALPPLHATRAVVTVTGTRVDRASRGGTFFEVWVSPAPTVFDWHQMNVPGTVWASLHVGASACLDERRGLLGATEATIRPCAETASPQAAARAWLASGAPAPSARMPLVQRLVDGDWEEVDRSLEDVQRRFEDGSATEADLERAFYAMETADPAVDAPLATWLAQRPRSYAAHLVAAMHAQLGGDRLRDGGYVAKNSPELNAEALEARARSELDIATRLTRLPVMAIEFDSAYLPTRGGITEVELMKRAVAIYPGDWIVRRLVLKHRPLCACTRTSGTAEAAMNDVLATHPSREVLARVEAERDYERGLSASQQDDAATASSFFEKALASGGSMHDRYRAAVELGFLDLNRARPEDAVALAQRAIEWVPENARAYLLLGVAYEREHRPADALAAYVASAARGGIDAQVNAGVLLLQPGMGVTADPLGAGRRLEIAAESGNDRARQVLRQHPELIPDQGLQAAR